MARRKERLEKLASNYTGFREVVLDVTDRKAVTDFFGTLSADVGNIDLLVNNAGVALDAKVFDEMDWQDIQHMVDTNVLGTAHFSWSYLRTTRQQSTRYIINIGSIAGNYAYPNNNIYGASKAFVNHLSKNLRSDYVTGNTRITSIEPGLARTEFSEVRFKGNVQKEQDLYANTSYIKAEDIASIVSYLISLPVHVNINQIEVMPNTQAWGPLSVTRGQRLKHN